MASLCAIRSALRATRLTGPAAATAVRHMCTAGSGVPPPLSTLTQDEEMMRDSVRRFAREVVAPKVSQMDEEGKLDPAVLKGLFDNGVRDAAARWCSLAG